MRMWQMRAELEEEEIHRVKVMAAEARLPEYVFIAQLIRLGMGEYIRQELKLKQYLEEAQSGRE